MFHSGFVRVRHSMSTPPPGQHMTKKNKVLDGLVCEIAGFVEAPGPGAVGIEVARLSLVLAKDEMRALRRRQRRRIKWPVHHASPFGRVTARTRCQSQASEDRRQWAARRIGEAREPPGEACFYVLVPGSKGLDSRFGRPERGR